jgi:regulator of replication initiation timing
MDVELIHIIALKDNKIFELEKEMERLTGFIEYLQARNKDMVNINGWHMKTNKHLRERITEPKDGEMKGKEIAELVYEWLNKRKNHHPDDLDMMFVGELLDEMEEDR